MSYLKDRAKEKSTIAGLGIIISMVAGLFGIQLGYEEVAAVSGAVGAVIGAAEVLRKEK